VCDTSRTTHPRSSRTSLPRDTNEKDNACVPRSPSLLGYTISKMKFCNSFVTLLLCTQQLGVVQGWTGLDPNVARGRVTSSLTDRRALLTGLITSAAAAVTWSRLGQKPALATETQSSSSLSAAEMPTGSGGGGGDSQEDVYFGVGCFWVSVGYFLGKRFRKGYRHSHHAF
jgi:hypothetical protein